MSRVTGIRSGLNRDCAFRNRGCPSLLHQQGQIWGSMTADDFSLQEVPDRLFDPKLWSMLKLAFASCSQSSGTAYRDAEALEALRPDSTSFIASARRDPTSWENPVVAAQIRVAELRDRLLADLRNKLTLGELLATGLVPPDPSRVEIPAFLWSELKLIVPDGAATGERFNFEDVRIALTAPRPPNRAARHLNWIRTHLPEIQELTKKEILPKAKFALGTDFRVRDFNAAYSKIFERNRGRPPKRPAAKQNK